MNQEERLSEPDLALLQLGRRLQADGYRFITPTPLTHERVNQRPGNERSRTLRDVFGWSRPFAPGLISADEQRQLQEAEVLEERQGLLHSRVRWSSLDGLLFAHSAFPTQSSDAVFFGPDSYRFAQLIHTHLQQNFTAVHRAVDIGCGAGVGAIVIARARREAQVLALDINPLALRLSAVNAALAEVGNLEIAHSDLLQNVDGQFDLIVANPPYMADPAERAYRDGGGALGAGLSLRIVEQALPRLTPGGSLVLYTGVAMVDGRDPFLEALGTWRDSPEFGWTYKELDPDVFGEELLTPGYRNVERIAVVALVVTRIGAGIGGIIDEQASEVRH
ncbi:MULTISPECIES: class I SAM-dependent methyltransferase [unclassified Pseudomonas]|uniref:methyltransferase n=1 Tax=unclassified Pseudomonas TaxID=196821 RepID=UPI00119BB4C2|nr:MULTISPECIES: class I SAM-dependent methyltransferase [unclassified Pseudomonas]TWC22946.1 methylase of polypeptide subunit release factors [Pseudomonas sp. SJZ075]TWC24789.1 methylase of polypeptide subunit release factors [Pseudomonas sp. SJZ074]TWC38174.1 methylase of polypeptide subunit release factors [Pseudomonas sp. SJZ078]TWC40994.1 methylase of polypeptide subunit release factors [Pseudomonas sp. SJZ085]TWC58764.1 methylase of polypeptide subunit release factors [Pseudomonas sp. SJ